MRLGEKAKRLIRRMEKWLKETEDLYGTED